MTKRCHCGSEMIPMFNFFACKAECDLPVSMRTKRTEAKAMPRANVSVSFDVTQAAQSTGWSPAAGDRVFWSLIVGIPATVTFVYDDDSAQIQYAAGAQYVAAFANLRPAP